MKALFLVITLAFSMMSLQIQAGGVAYVSPSAPIGHTQNVKNCVLLSQWWYVTPEMGDVQQTLTPTQSNQYKQYEVLRVDALKSGCDIGEFCGRCGPFSCLIKAHYYGCRNLCQFRSSGLSQECLVAGKIHSLAYHFQLQKGLVPMPSEKIMASQRLVWAMDHKPQMDKVLNIGWNAKSDVAALPAGIPLPNDIPQVAFSGGVRSKLGISEMKPGMVLTTATDGIGYIHLTTNADLLASPMGYAISQQNQVVKSALSGLPIVSTQTSYPVASTATPTPNQKGG